MNKKILTLLLSGMMIVPMTGCDAHLAIGGKEIFNFSDNGVQQENVVQNDKEVKDKENNKTNKVEEKKEETKQQEEKTVEEKDKEIEEKYCDWCGDHAGHSTDEHVTQCYDCGEYKPIKDMIFNGRSYYCGCANEYCEECKQEIPYGEENYVCDEVYLCDACYTNYLNEQYQQEQEQNNQVSCEGCGRMMDANEAYNSDGYNYCEDCYNNGAATWVCPNCGASVPNGEMCECEWNE